MNHKGEILFIDDDVDILKSCKHLFTLLNYRVKISSRPKEIHDIITTNWDGIIISDIYMPALNGLDLLIQIHSIDDQIPVIMMTGHGDIPLAVNAVKKGAFDFIEKPFEPSEMIHVIDKALKCRQTIVNERNKIIKGINNQLIGKSAAILQIKSLLQGLARSKSDVMIEGEIGSGRYTIAHLLHQISQPTHAPLVVIDCRDEINDLHTEMLKGKHGTVILRHPEFLSLTQQINLANYLLDQERKKVKAFCTILIIENSAQKLVVSEKLHAELYYYFSQVNLCIPALRERKVDIHLLFEWFVNQTCARLQLTRVNIDKHYIDCLHQYSWPGNIRELRHIAELYSVGIVKLPHDTNDRIVPKIDQDLDSLLNDYEKKTLEDSLTLYNGKINEVANYLNIPRKKLYLRMRKYNLDKDNYKIMQN